MGLQNIKGTLLTRSAGSSADETGTTYRIDQRNASMSASFSALFHFTITGGTSPTLDVYLDLSADGSNWIQALNMTQLTSGSRNERIALSWGAPYMRVRVDAGGTANPTWTGTVYLISDQEFTLVTP